MLVFPPFAVWARDFVLTQIVEVPIYRRAFDASYPEAFGASLLTHPLLAWVVMPVLRQHLTFWPAVAVAEVGVVLVEAAYFAFGFRRKNALLWSFVANATSFGIGILSWLLFS